jgi:hypothetical protein
VSALADAQPKEEETMGLQLTRRVIHAWLLCGAALLAACGGGGGRSEPPAAATVPTISAPPASASVAAGQPATFSVSANGSAPLSYQWLREGVAIAGATGDSYSIGAAAVGDNAARFSVVVSNAAGSVTSAEATLTVSAVSAAPSITAQPAAATVASGAAASFTVIANGSAPLTYQWRRNGTNIAGATTSSYTTAATTVGDDGARFSVVVSNALGSVTSGEAVLTVTATAAPPPARYVPVWSSVDTTNGSGSYTLSVVDPATPTSPIAVDQVPAGDAATNNAVSFVNLFGGAFDAASGQVRDPGVRNLVYVKAGAIYRVNLDKGGAAPAPSRLSTETQARFPSAAAVSASGDEALITYFIPNSVIRYVSLSAAGSTAPRAAPVFPGDVPSSSRFLGSATDPATGAISALYWESAPLNVKGRRLFRTDAAFGNATSIATFASTNLGPLWGGVRYAEGASMQRGLFFIADSALRRLDFATGVVRVVHAGVNFKVGQGVRDDSHLYLLVENTSGVRQLVRAADDDSTPGQVIASGTTIAGYSVINTQTRDYLIFITGSNGGTAVSLRKTDGLVTLLPEPASPPGLPHTWNTAASLNDETLGNRVFYQFPGRFGSVHADGTDRREYDGSFKVKRMLPSALPPHRLHGGRGGMPAARVLAQNAAVVSWLELSSGVLGVTVGNEPSGANFGNDALSPYGSWPIGRAGAVGYSQLASGTTVGRLDAIYLTDQANSLLRLTNNIP